MRKYIFMLAAAAALAAPYAWAQTGDGCPCSDCPCNDPCQCDR